MLFKNVNSDLLKFEVLDYEDLVICDKFIDWKMLLISLYLYNIIFN